MEIKNEKKTSRYEALLFVTTMAWSLSFIWTKIVTNTGMASEMYLFLRYGLAALLLLPFSAKKLFRATRKEILTGLAMGSIFFGGMMFQTAGIALTTPSNSSFITTAYVVFAPLTTWLMMKKKPGRNIYIAVVLCLIGIYILNITPGESLSLSLGNALTLAGALGWAFQLTYTSIAGAYMDPFLLSFLSFGFTGLGGLAVSLVKGSIFTTSPAQLGGSALAIILAAVFPTILANLIQVYAQHRVDPNKAAVIYTMEAVFATVISIIIGLESFSLTVLMGGGVILSAVLMCQLEGEKDNA